MSNIDISDKLGKSALLVGLLSALLLTNVACTNLKRQETDQVSQVDTTQPVAQKETSKDSVLIAPDKPTSTPSSTPEAAIVDEPAEIPLTAEETSTKTPAVEFSKSELAEMRAQVDALCQAIGSKLGSVSIDDCLSHQMVHSGKSTAGRSLSYRDFPPLAGKPSLGKILILGGIHGDEFSSVSVMFKWMNILNQHHSGLFHWRFVPSLNPDGLLKKKSQRQNELGVDLNRNFPTVDWSEQAHDHWVNKAGKSARRYPGEAAASEAETQWLVEQIKTFKPDVIISMHAPYHLVDYDGPPTAPDKLGGLYLRKLGVYPGSLGNYAGVDLKLPIVTVELKAAGTMPTSAEINRMWTDLVRWLRRQLTP